MVEMDKKIGLIERNEAHQRYVIDIAEKSAQTMAEFNQRLDMEKAAFIAKSSTKSFWDIARPVLYGAAISFVINAVVNGISGLVPSLRDMVYGVPETLDVRATKGLLQQINTDLSTHDKHLVDLVNGMGKVQGDMSAHDESIRALLTQYDQIRLNLSAITGIIKDINLGSISKSDDIVSSFGLVSDIAGQLSQM